MDSFISTTLFLLPFCGLSLLALAGISVIGGWSDLAKAYPYNDEPLSGESFRCQSLSIKLLGWYRNTMTVIVTEDGIYLQPIFFLRFMHPPIYIRWHDISKHSFKKIILGNQTLIVGNKKINITGRSAKCIEEGIKHLQR